MIDHLLFPVLIILCVVGAGLITYSIYRKFLKDKKKSVRAALTVLTIALSIAVVGTVLMFATLMIFGR